MHVSQHDLTQLQQWITEWLSRELKRPVHAIGPTENLLNYGMDSVNATMLVGDLEDHLGIRLSPTLIWDAPTVVELTEVLSRQVSDSKAGSPEAGTPTRGLTVSSDINDAEARELLNRLNELSDADVDALLQRLSRSSKTATE